jgi:hypothetical protein
VRIRHAQDLFLHGDLALDGKRSIPDPSGATIDRPLQGRRFSDEV